MRIGIDVGGTNTDAVLMDGHELLAQAKLPTTPDITSGIVACLEEVLGQTPAGAVVTGVMLQLTSPTHC